MCASAREHGAGDGREDLLSVRRAEGRLARALGVTTSVVSAWEAGWGEGGITAAVALRLEMLTGRSGTAAFVLGVLPIGPYNPPGLPRLDSNQKPPGLRYLAA